MLCVLAPDVSRLHAYQLALTISAVTRLYRGILKYLRGLVALVLIIVDTFEAYDRDEQERHEVKSKGRTAAAPHFNSERHPPRDAVSLQQTPFLTSIHKITTDAISLPLAPP